ncbi:MAG: L-threonylcarbamoyladenylate synthase [Bacteroidota bacterium]
MEEEIRKTIKVLKAGGIILYPTDTVWGIGCDATIREAVEKIRKLKRRKKNNGFIVLADNREMLLRYVIEIPASLRDLIDIRTPLTVIYPHSKGLAGNVVAEDGSIGIRITRDEFCRKLVCAFKKPIVSTSANISGSPVPCYYKQINEHILNGVDYIVNLRRNEKDFSKPSEVIKLAVNGEIEIVRK